MNRHPPACTLTELELRQRRAGVLARLGESVEGRRELTDGFGFRFQAKSSTLRLLVEVIDLERQCCPFLNFVLTVEAAEGEVWLDLTGPPGAKEFIATLLPHS